MHTDWLSAGVTRGDALHGLAGPRCVEGVNKTHPHVGHRGKQSSGWRAPRNLHRLFDLQTHCPPGVALIPYLLLVA